MRRGAATSLRTRLIIAFLTVSILVSGLLATSASWLRQETLIDTATAQALVDLNADLLLAGRWVNDRGEALPDGTRVLDDDELAALGTALSAPEGEEILLVQPDGTNYRTEARLDPDTLTADMWAIIERGVVASKVDGAGDPPMLVVGGRTAADALAVFRVVDLTPVQAELVALRTALLRAVVVPVLAALLLAYAVANRVLRPVRRAQRAAQDFGEGNLDVRLPVGGDDEFSQLAVSFNDMADRLRSTIHDLSAIEARQRRFVADVSHELRSPLAAMIASVDVLEEERQRGQPHDGTRRDARRAAELVAEQTRKLHRLVEDLLEINRFDEGRAPLERAEVHLAGLVDEVRLAAGHEQAVQSDVPHDLYANVDHRRVRTVLSNLMNNAVRHGAAPAWVKAYAAGREVVIEVEDSGHGVPAAEAERIFDRFARLDVARGSSATYGLGLAIARENVRLHGGDLTLATTQPASARFVARFPSAAASAHAVEAAKTRDDEILT